MISCFCVQNYEKYLVFGTKNRLNTLFFIKNIFFSHFFFVLSQLCIKFALTKPIVNLFITHLLFF